MKQNAMIYYCPECQKDVAAGNLLSLKVICPYCLEFIILNSKTDGIKPLGKSVLEKKTKRTYGHDKLTLDQMYETRADALKAGHSHYFTGQPCRHGHIAPRTKKGDCHECTRLQKDRYLALHMDRVKQSSKKFLEKKKEKRSIYLKKYREKNKEQIKAYKEANKTDK